MAARLQMRDPQGPSMDHVPARFRASLGGPSGGVVEQGLRRSDLDLRRGKAAQVGAEGRRAWLLPVHSGRKIAARQFFDALTAWRALSPATATWAAAIPCRLSAGSGLTLGLIGALRDAGEDLPGCAWLISPSADLTMSGKTHARPPPCFTDHPTMAHKGAGAIAPATEEQEKRGTSRCWERLTIRRAHRRDRPPRARHPRRPARRHLPRQGGGAVPPIPPAAAWTSARREWRRFRSGSCTLISHGRTRSDNILSGVRTRALRWSKSHQWNAHLTPMPSSIG
jgi:hypothetical protein